MVPNEKNLGLSSHVRICSEKKGRNTIYAISKIETQNIVKYIA